jgi:hypothetical protein
VLFFFQGGGLQFSMQVLGMAMIIGWSAGNAIVLFVILKYAGIFRASKEEEERGMDVVKHGTYGYLFDYDPMTDKARAAVNVHANASDASVPVVAAKEWNSQPVQKVSTNGENGAKNVDNDQASSSSAAEMGDVAAVKKESESESSSSSQSSSSEQSARQSNNSEDSSSESSLND